MEEEFETCSEVSTAECQTCYSACESTDWGVTKTFAHIHLRCNPTHIVFIHKSSALVYKG